MSYTFYNLHIYVGAYLVKVVFFRKIESKERCLSKFPTTWQHFQRLIRFISFIHKKIDDKQTTFYLL